MWNKIKEPQLDLALPIESGILDLKSQQILEKEPKDRIKWISAFLKRVEDEIPESDITKTLIEILTRIPVGGQIWADSIKVKEEWYEYLDVVSKKKLIVYKIKKIYSNEYQNLSDYEKSTISEKAYVKAKFQELHKLMKKVSYFGFIIIKVLERYKPNNEINKIMIEYINLMISQTAEDKTDICQTIDDFCTKDEAKTIFLILEKIWVDKKIIWMLNYEYNNFDAIEQEIINSNKSRVPENTEDSLIWFEEVNDWKLNMNLHIIPLTIINWSKIFGIERTRTIYRNSFDKIIEKITTTSWWVEPSHNGIFTYRLHTLNSINKRLKIWWSESQDTKDNWDYTFQNNLIWDVEWISDEDFVNMWIILKSIDHTINLSNKWLKPFDKKLPLPFSGDIEYKWIFCLNAWLEDTNLLLLVDKKTWKQYVRLSLVWTDQDQYIYTISQISYYLKHKKTIKSTQLYSNIYHEYNVLRTQWSEQFNIKFFDEQYKSIIKQLIFPLSTQYYQKYGKMWNAKNSLLVWLYGTGKSQFLIELLRKKEFPVNWNWEVLNLNANVISLSILEFMELLKSETNWFKNRLTEIYENTRIPIILIIEDLDTMVNESWGWASLYTQALTLFFEWVWHYPIKIVTTTNYPQEFPTRLLRPNRIDNVINFSLPLKDEILIELLKDHFHRNQLDKHLEFEQLDKFLDKMKYFTPSHISSFMKLIKSHIDYEIEFNTDYKISTDEIEKVFHEMPVPLDDIKKMQKWIKTWLESLTQQWSWATIGFGNRGNLDGQKWTEIQARKK